MKNLGIFRKKKNKILLTLIIIGLVVILDSFDLKLSSDNIVEIKNGEIAIVKRVIDGDTIVLDSGSIVRYIGIDTPENTNKTECYGEESTLRNRELVENKTVKLVKDKSDTDRYGRLLRYVYIDSFFVNQVLVEEGYARAVSYPPDTDLDMVLNDSQRIARELKIGIWSQCVEK